MPSRAANLLTCWAVALLLVPASASTTSPRASFSVDKGWVRLRVERDSAPLAGARVRVFDHREEIFAEGETDEKGEGVFPTLPDHTCQIGITVNGKECDLIPLRLHGRKAEPERVLLSFGSRPCCRNLRPASPPFSAYTPFAEEEAPSSERYWPWAALSGGLFLTAISFFLLRKFRARPNRPVLSATGSERDNPA